jgi:hypothetical protein
MDHEIDTPIKSTQFSWPTGVPVGEVEEHSGLDVLNHLQEDSKMETTQQPQQKREPSNLFESKEDYLAFRKQWSKIAAARALTADMMLLYNVIRKKSPERGFAPITNKVKLENGANPNGGYTGALSDLRYIAVPKNRSAEEDRVGFLATFEGAMTDEFFTKVANYLPT